MKVEAYVWNKTGKEVKAQCANRPAGEVTKKICVTNDYVVGKLPYCDTAYIF